MYMPAQIQLKMVKMVEIEPESDAPRGGERRGGREGRERERDPSPKVLYLFPPFTDWHEI